MKKTIKLVIVATMILFIATPTMAQNSNDVITKTRYVYFWDVTASLNNDGLKDLTFKYLKNYIKNNLDNGHEVIVYPFNDDIKNANGISISNSNDIDTLIGKGEQYLEEHAKSFNNNCAKKGKPGKLGLGGHTNVCAATKKAEELFTSKKYNTIAILVTDGDNEYPYDYNINMKGIMDPLDAKIEGRKELRVGIEKAIKVAQENKKTLNVLIYVAFGNDNPYEGYDSEREDMEETKKFKFFKPGSKFDVKFPTVTAMCKKRKGKDYHMCSRDHEFTIEFTCHDKLEEDLEVSIECEGECLEKPYEFKGTVSNNAISVEGLPDIDESKFDGNNEGSFHVSIEITNYIYDGENLYYVITPVKQELDVLVTKDFSGSIKVRLK